MLTPYSNTHLTFLYGLSKKGFQLTKCITKKDLASLQGPNFIYSLPGAPYMSCSTEKLPSKYA
jgi:hypothetical protein